MSISRDTSGSVSICSDSGFGAGFDFLDGGFSGSFRVTSSGTTSCSTSTLVNFVDFLSCENRRDRLRVETLIDGSGGSITEVSGELSDLASS